MTTLAAAIALLLLAAPAAAETISGYGTCHDGDTCRIGGLPIRLKGVAAPEMPLFGRREEPGARSARDFVRAMVRGRLVTCELTGETTHGRQVGFCSVDGQDIGAALVAAGLARACPAYDPRYLPLEQPGAPPTDLPLYCETRR